MALLKFFAAAAGAGVVAAYAGVFGVGRWVTGGGGAVRNIRYKIIRQVLGLRVWLDVYGNVEDAVDDLLINFFKKLLEHYVAFFFVFHKRVTLAVTTQADAVAQMIHCV